MFGAHSGSAGKRRKKRLPLFCLAPFMTCCYALCLFFFLSSFAPHPCQVPFSSHVLILAAGGVIRAGGAHGAELFMASVLIVVMAVSLSEALPPPPPSACAGAMSEAVPTPTCTCLNDAPTVSHPSLQEEQGG